MSQRKAWNTQREKCASFLYLKYIYVTFCTDSKLSEIVQIGEGAGNDC